MCHASFLLLCCGDVLMFDASYGYICHPLAHCCCCCFRWPTMPVVLCCSTSGRTWSSTSQHYSGGLGMDM